MFLKLVVVLAVSWRCAARRDRSALRVYKGEKASLKEFPFIVMLMTQLPKAPFRRLCTGSLIAETWVLTAAHCFFHEMDPQNDLIVRFGDFVLPANNTKLYSKILNIFVPTRFQTMNQIFLNQIQKPVKDDIGLLLTERVPNKPTVKLLALDYKSLFGLPVKYAGFVFTHKKLLKIPMEYKLKQASVPLQVGEGVLLPCDNFGNFGPIMCVEPKCSNRAQGGRGGDSGGPLVYDGRIIGVVKGPAVWTLAMAGGSFTPVSIYLEWIKQVMFSNGYVDQNRKTQKKKRFSVVRI